MEACPDQSRPHPQDPTPNSGLLTCMEQEHPRLSPCTTRGGHHSMDHAPPHHDEPRSPSLRSAQQAPPRSVTARARTNRLIPAHGSPTKASRQGETLSRRKAVINQKFKSTDWEPADFNSPNPTQKQNDTNLAVSNRTAPTRSAVDLPSIE